MIKVIAFVGKAGAGKTTAAQYLVNRHKYIRLRFADPLKEMIKCLGVSMEEIDGEKKVLPNAKLCGKSPRYAMQRLGTEWGRMLIGDDLWVNYLAREIDRLSQLGFNKFVIDDCRFLNEAKWVNDLNYPLSCGYKTQIIRIIGRPDNPNDTHQSETEMDKIKVDWLIKNESTMEIFYSAIEAWEALS